MQSTRCILLVVAVVIASACAAPFVRRNGKPYVVAQRRYSSGYASGYASGSSSGSPSPPAGSVTMTQKVTLSITAAQYNGNMVTLMNTAYGIVLAIYVPATGGGSWRQGCSVTSAVSSRRTVVIQFTATVSPAYATTAQANSKSMSAGNLQAAASTAKTDLGAAF